MSVFLSVSLYLFIIYHLSYSLNPRKVVRGNSEESQVKESHVSLQKSATAQIRCKPIAKCTSGGMSVTSGGMSVPCNVCLCFQAGHHVIVYERNVEVGGLLRYGIPTMKLGKDVCSPLRLFVCLFL